jgi:hypothetical protein
MWPHPIMTAMATAGFIQRHHQSAFLRNSRFRGMSVLSREIGWRIILVSQRTLKEKPEKNRMGKQRRSMNVAEESPPHTSGSKDLSFPHKELRTEEPLAVEAHVFIMFHATRSCVTYCSYLDSRTSICQGETNSFVHPVHGRQKSSLLASANR